MNLETVLSHRKENQEFEDFLRFSFKLFKIVPFAEIDQILLFANKQFYSNFFHDF